MSGFMEFGYTSSNFTAAPMTLSFGGESIVPSLDLNFLSGSIDPLLTVTRASSATYFDSAGILQTASANTGRIDYNPSTLAIRGLLVEEGRTNIALWNRELINAAWVKTNITAAKDQTGVDGVSNSASSITATAANGTCLQTVVLGSSARYLSAYVKRLSGSGAIQMTIDSGLTWTPVTVTSSWTRVEIPTQTLVNPVFGFRIVTSGDAIAVDFVQNENGVFATSAIATTAGSVIRSADDITASNLLWLGTSEGTLFGVGTSFAASAAGQNNGIFSVDDGTTANRIQVRQASTSGNLTVFSGAVSQAAVSVASKPVGSRHKFAGAYAANDFIACVDGTLSSADTSGTVPSGITTGRIGNAIGVNYWNGWIESVAAWKSRLSNAVLQGLTT